MRKRIATIIVLASLLGAPGVIAAQTGSQPGPVPTRLTLELATEILLARNPILLRERQNIAIARGDVTGARKLPNPEFELVSESYPAFENRPGSFLNNQELVLRAAQPIETAGKRRKRTAVAEQDVVVAQTSLEDTIRRLKLELGTRYYSVVLGAAQHELAKEVLEQFDSVLKLNELRYRQGEVSGLELTRLRAERLRFFNDLLEAETQLRNAKTALLELLGADSLTAEFQVAEQLQFTPVSPDVQVLQQQAREARADLIAARQTVERDRLELTHQKALGIPNIIPAVGYKRDFGLNTVAFGVSIPLPLFNRNQGGVARAAAELEQERHELQRVDLAVRREVQQAFQILQAQRQRVEALEQAYVPAARRARDIAQASYRLGALDLIGFLDAERTYRETLRGYNQALYDYNIAGFALEAAVGKEF